MDINVANKNAATSQRFQQQLDTLKASVRKLFGLTPGDTKKNE